MRISGLRSVPLFTYRRNSNNGDMSDDSVRCWLVDRQSRDENLVTLVYATPDRERYATQARAMAEQHDPDDEV